jgi:hypothetical protein
MTALSTEAIIAIVSIIVSLPPTLLVLWSVSRRRLRSGAQPNAAGMEIRQLILSSVPLSLESDIAHIRPKDDGRQLPIPRNQSTLNHEMTVVVSISGRRL